MTADNRITDKDYPEPYSKALIALFALELKFRTRYQSLNELRHMKDQAKRVKRDWLDVKASLRKLGYTKPENYQPPIAEAKRESKQGDKSKPRTWRVL